MSDIIAKVEENVLYYGGVFVLSCILLFTLGTFLTATINPPQRVWYWSSIFFMMFLGWITWLVLLAIYTKYGRLLVETMIVMFVAGLMISASIYCWIELVRLKSKIGPYYKRFEDEVDLEVDPRANRNEFLSQEAQIGKLDVKRGKIFEYYDEYNIV